MIPSDAELVTWIGKGYRDVAAFDHVGTTAGVDWRIKYLSDTEAVLNLPGSEKPLDWLRDFLAIPLHEHPMVWSHDLGYVHAGFYAGVVETWAVVKPLLAGRQIYLPAHSKGAGTGACLVGVMMLDGRCPTKVLLCGAPQPGFARLAAVVQSVPCSTYWNTPSHPTIEDPPDPVDTVPYRIPPLFLYQHAWPTITDIDVPPPHDPWDFVARHHDVLYEQGIRERQ